MPSTRRSASGNAASGARGKQSTLSFNHRVTKSVARPKDQKSALSPAAVAKKLSEDEAEAAAPPAVAVVVNNDDEDEEADVDDGKSSNNEVAAAAAVDPQELERERAESAARSRADQVSDRQIEKYWRALEGERRTRRLHQDDLGLAEKVLRYWDVSSQYGPCVGVTRLRRWQRADRLGLEPPIEVLAVLQQQERAGTKGLERAHMDEILNSTV